MDTETSQQNLLVQVEQVLERHASLLDAYSDLEPLILDLFNSERMSIFQRRRQHQDLVARYYELLFEI